MRIEALLLCFLFATFSNPLDAGDLPRGTPVFTLGMSREELDSRILQRGLQRISEAHGVVSFSTDVPDGEFERYAFMRAPVDSQIVLWQATIAYKFPVDSTVFRRVAEQLESVLGPPRIVRGGREPGGRLIGLHERAWTDDRVTVRLAVRWSPESDLNTDRMLLTWTDLRLQRMSRVALAEARNRRAGR